MRPLFALLLAATAAAAPSAATNPNASEKKNPPAANQSSKKSKARSFKDIVQQLEKAGKNETLSSVRAEPLGLPADIEIKTLWSGISGPPNSHDRYVSLLEDGGTRRLLWLDSRFNESKAGTSDDAWYFLSSADGKLEKVYREWGTGDDINNGIVEITAETRKSFSRTMDHFLKGAAMSPPPVSK